ncbi:CD59 glycoprotein-like [Actinia tenebrosa]|uniref:CD59 glycoprotein-like n=1 Tax=Actinia tenebrosa TaxID=6105 RepID=A0A6P8I475_ACTTE|nr:CD59 glycoprotein-like [Actinia tenebrosa]
MKLLIVTLCVLAALIPAALSIKCYSCESENGNCVEGEKTCQTKYDRCLKGTKDNKVSKSCSTSLWCSTVKKLCKSSGDCEAYCCDSDLCNGGVPLKPVTFTTLLAMTLAVAKYLM